MVKETDVVIIGAGAVGCSIARELSKYRLKVMVVDKNEDVGGDASKSNSAIIHTGYDATPGTLESELVVAANPMYNQLTMDLDVPISWVGAILPAFTDEQYEKLPSIREKAIKNRVYDVEYLTKEELLKMEPNLNPDVKSGLYIPREGIIDPFLLVLAYAENANANGADFYLNAKVCDVLIENGSVKGVKLENGEEIRAAYVINAAGLHCDDIAAMAGKKDYEVNPRKGQFYILDKNTSCKVNHIVLPIPTKLTKGKLVCPTIHGNILAGPTAEDLSDKEDKSTDAAGLASVREDVSRLVPGIRFGDTITQYSGLRPNRTPEGVYIDLYDDLKGYLNISGVRSTGLTLSASIGVYVAQTLEKAGMELTKKADFQPKRQGIKRFKDLPTEEKNGLIEQNPAYGRIICRCETVAEGEITEAIHGPIPARSLDALKRRLRSGMGRCQGGFCGPRIISILATELGCSPEEITKNNKGSFMITGKVR